jgi:RNA polymerase sigma-70 factor, ECF subfamily
VFNSSGAGVPQEDFYRRCLLENVMRWNPLAAAAGETCRTETDPDAELMIRFQNGDLEAFETLFSRHVRPLVNFAYRFVRNRGVAEELAQEVFLRVHDAAGSYKQSARFTTWLYRIATNLCLNELRRPQSRTRHESLDAPPDDGERTVPLDIEDRSRGSAHSALERDDISRALKAALEDLPEKQRVAFILNKYQELSYAEVAEVMQLSEKAVKSLIHRAKEGMAERLRPLLSRVV